MRIISTGREQDGGGDSAGDGAGETPVDTDSLRPLMGTAREALTRGLGHPGTPLRGVPDGLLVSCSCGHLYLADGATPR